MKSIILSALLTISTAFASGELYSFWYSPTQNAQQNTTAYINGMKYSECFTDADAKCAFPDAVFVTNAPLRNVDLVWTGNLDRATTNLLDLIEIKQRVSGVYALKRDYQFPDDGEYLILDARNPHSHTYRRFKIVEIIE